MVAAFFATEPELTHDRKIGSLPENGGAIYVLHDCKFLDAYERIDDPFGISTHNIVYAPVVTNRIAGQGGVFTIHPDPRQEFQVGFEGSTPKSPRWIHKLVFSKEIATQIQQSLFFLGVRKGSIYPDLDGFSGDIKIRFALGDCHSSE